MRAGLAEHADFDAACKKWLYLVVEVGEMSLFSSNNLLKADVEWPELKTELKRLLRPQGGEVATRTAIMSKKQ